MITIPVTERDSETPGSAAPLRRLSLSSHHQTTHEWNRLLGT
jgi:hypothetical protein